MDIKETYSFRHFFSLTSTSYKRASAVLFSFKNLSFWASPNALQGQKLVASRVSLKDSPYNISKVVKLEVM